MARLLRLDMVIRHDNDKWRVIGLGIDDHPEYPGMVFCHLASTTRYRQQRNGAVPVQRCTWIKGQLPKGR